MTIAVRHPERPVDASSWLFPASGREPQAVVKVGLRSDPVPVMPVPARLPAFMRVMANATSSPEGEFQIDGLLVGTYAICVEYQQGGFLNPCLWMDQPVTVNLAAGAYGERRFRSGVEGGHCEGCGCRTRKGLLAATAYDWGIGTSHGKALFIPGLVTGRDATGRTMAVVVQPGLQAPILVASVGFALRKRIGAWHNSDSDAERDRSNRRERIRNSAANVDRAGDREEVRGDPQRHPGMKWHFESTAIVLRTEKMGPRPFAFSWAHWRRES